MYGSGALAKIRLLNTTIFALRTRQVTPDGVKLLLRRVRQIQEVDLFSEEQTIRRAAAVEEPDLVALADPLSLLARDLARRHLRHADEQRRHEADVRAIGLDEDQRPRRHGRHVRIGPRQVILAVEVVRGIETLVRRFGEVEAREQGDFDDGAAHGRVPAVVAERVEIRLVDGAGYEVAAEVVVAEHVNQGVGCALGPELGGILHVVLHCAWCGLACLHDHVVVLGTGYRSYAIAEVAGEKVVP